MPKSRGRKNRRRTQSVAPFMIGQLARNSRSANADFCSTMEWYPIDGAPKDGNPRSGVGRKRHARHVFGRTFRGFSKGGLFQLTTGARVLGKAGFRPTHWQLLPKPPAN